MKIVRKLLLILSIGFLSCFTVGFGFYLAATGGVRLDPQKLLLPNAQIIVYDGEGNKIVGAAGFQNRDIVPLKELPKHLANAFIATEDKRFYRHNGFDLVGITRAVIKNVKNRGFSQGASTISQQLIKNTHLSLDKTLKRKMQEIKLTKQLERKYDKNQILETYLNTIYFGHNCYGIAAAAEFYFEKNPQDLTLAESALLAGLVKAPNHYSPFKNADKALTRRKVVLGLMQQQKYISEKEYKNALNTPLPTSYRQFQGKSYAHFAIEEMDKILEEQGLPANGKIELYTHFNPRLQEIVESQKSATDCDKTYAIVNNKTKGIEAYLSTVSNPKRAPGSILKPLLIYAPAFEEGLLCPASPILDQRTDFSGYKPKNFQDEYHGYVSARYAIAKSLNVPAVKTLNALTLEKAGIYAEKMGLTLSKEDKTLALALGAMQYGFRFTDLLSAYTSLASEGNYESCQFVSSVLINGVPVYHQNALKKSVFSPETAYLITDTLKTAADEGTAKKMRTLSFPIAAKTGTVGTQKGNTDAYTVAYTTEHTFGVWLGNADNRPITTTGGGLPCSICKTLAEKTYPIASPKDFTMPAGIKQLSIDREYYERENRILLSDKTAPMKYKKIELFDSRYAPKEISTLFSNPKITTPAIEINEKGARIYFDTEPPKYYRYQILKEVDGKKKIIYDGEAFCEYVDANLTENKRYRYTIIPYYEKNVGAPVSLPAVLAPQKPLPEIVDKPWWNE